MKFLSLKTKIDIVSLNLTSIILIYFLPTLIHLNIMRKLFQTNIEIYNLVSNMMILYNKIMTFYNEHEFLK